jgi:PKD repeat protein
MIKENKKINIFFAIVAAAIIIIATFTVVTQYQVSDLTATAKEKEELPLLVSISADKSSGTIPLEVSFTPIVSNSVGNVEYYWDFGDGNTSKEMSPVYIYKKTGSFVCNLTATDSNGKKESGSVVITINPIKMQTPGIEVNPRQSERPFLEHPKLMLLSVVLRNNFYKKVDLRERLVVNMIDKPGYEPLKNIFFSNVDGWVSCTAQVTNPGDVETYKWTLIGPNYIGPPPKGGIFRPSYYFTTENNTVKFPAVYTYREGGYSIILELEDSNGEVIGTNSDGFSVIPSNTKLTIESVKTLIFVTGLGFIIAQWKQTWSKDPDGAMYKRFDEKLNNILEWKSPFASAITLRVLELLISANVLDVWDKIPEEWAEFYKLQIDRGIIDEDKVRDRLEKNVNNIVSDNLRGKILGALCSLLNLDYRLVQRYLGFINHAPDQIDPFPEKDAKQIPINCPYVSITVEDREADLFNVTIYGEYVNNVTYNSQNNGTFTATLITPLPENTDITWYVNATDINGNEDIKPYKFETFIDV